MRPSVETPNKRLQGTALRVAAEPRRYTDRAVPRQLDTFFSAPRASLMSDSAPQPYVVVVFGATGTAGTGVLQACITDARVTEVRAVTRRPLQMAHPKVREVLCATFSDLGPITEALSGVDACLFCLGTSVRNVAGETEYREIHVTYALVAARAVLARSPHAAFVYLSGAGANRRSRMMWARVKAEAEDQLAELPLAHLVCVRPGGISPTQPSGFDRWFIAPLIKALPSLGIGAEELGRAMLAAARDRTGTARLILGNRVLKALAAGTGTPGGPAPSSLRAV